MNLELLDPFRRQIPDRVDSTLSLPTSLHPSHNNQKKQQQSSQSNNADVAGGADDDSDVASGGDPTPRKSSSSKSSSSEKQQQQEQNTTAAADDMNIDDDDEWKAAYHVSFNRRGTYLAVGHAKGTVAVHDFLSRTLSALYRPPEEGENTYGVTSVTWSRRSRTLLAGAVGDTTVRLFDTTHPLGPDECCPVLTGGEDHNGASTSATTSTAAAAASASETTSSTTTTKTTKNKAAGGGGGGNNDDAEDSGGSGGGKSKSTTSSKKSTICFDNNAYEQIEMSKKPRRLKLQVINASSRPDSNKEIDTQETDLHKEEQQQEEQVQQNKIDAGDSDVADLVSSAPVAAEVVEESTSSGGKSKKAKKKKKGSKRNKKQRYATLLWEFPEPVGGSLQIHPRDNTSGVAVLSSGSLVLFRAPPSAWKSSPTSTNNNKEPVVKLITLWNVADDEDDNDNDVGDGNHPITCAAFSPYGDKLYAATKDGILLGFHIQDIINKLKNNEDDNILMKDLLNKNKMIKPAFQISIPGSATAWHLIVSRNGKLLLINCSDGALRLYNTTDCWGDINNNNMTSKNDEAEEIKVTSSNDAKPTFVFQDIVSKAPFASCDFSGDGEYVVGGCNGDNEKYELYLWNTTTGALMDRLTGAQVSLYSVTWHPTRSFLAVGTSDGLVDIWGPRMDWTAFAPDFQALPMNVEYVEREDEFDIVDDKLINDGQEDLSGTATIEVDEGLNADETVDVVTIDSVPVFASDSESESEVFYFDTKIKNIMAGRGRNTAQGWKGDKEE